jgi:hypothetical protein
MYWYDPWIRVLTSLYILPPNTRQQCMSGGITLGEIIVFSQGSYRENIVHYFPPKLLNHLKSDLAGMFLG